MFIILEASKAFCLKIATAPPNDCAEFPEKVELIIECSIA